MVVGCYGMKVLMGVWIGCDVVVNVCEIVLVVVIVWVYL